MTQETWSAVDDYVHRTVAQADPVLVAAQRDADAAGLPGIAVTASQGKLLMLLARMSGARTILEVGTLGGYSTIWLARALPPGGRLVTLELDPGHAEVARANLARAGLDGRGDLRGDLRVDLRVGRALDTLPLLESEGAGPFDLVFVDADKPSNADYVTWALRLTRPGSVIVVDNVVRKGAVADAGSDDPAVQGARRVYELVAAEPKLDATVVQTVGDKGYDGFLLAVVTG